MNELDSELVVGQLSSLGYRMVSDPAEAGVVLYNTCSVRDLAEQKVRSRLGEMAQRKRAEPGLVVGVLGCMAERDGAALIARMPVVDILCGPAELDKLPGLLDNAVRTRDSLLADAETTSIPTSGTVVPSGTGVPPVRSRLGEPCHPDTSGTGVSPVRVAIRSANQIALQGAASRRTATLAAAADRLELLDLSRAISPTDHSGSAYVRITRGCNKFCTYCVVPHTRGAEVHRPPDHIVDECKRLADAGVIEVTLLGQTVNHYRFEHGAAVSIGGITQPQKGRAHRGPGLNSAVAALGRVTTFADLLKRIHDEVPEIRRLRFVTSYPRDFGDDALRVMRESPRICRYLHVPAQTGSDAVLKRMNRGYTVGEYLDFIDRARAHLDQPEIGRPLMIAGDMIVGFPGETDDDFAASVRLLERVRYKNCFIFKYSPRPGTAAFDRIPDDVPESIKRRRNNDLLAVQHDISDEIAQSQVGRTLDIFVEGVSARERKRKPIRAAGGVALTIGGRDQLEASSDDAAGESVQLAGRTDGDLIVLFDAPAAAAAEMIGRIVPIRIARANTLTLFGARLV